MNREKIRYEDKEYIEQFVDICRRHFFKDNSKEHRMLINDLIDLLYIKYNIQVNELKVYFKKDKSLKLSKNPTYVTDGRLSIKNNKLYFVFNDDLLKLYYKENKYIDIINIVFHEWGHFLQLLYLKDIQRNNMPNYLLEDGEKSLSTLKHIKLHEVEQTQFNLEIVKDFAKWLELSNKKNVMEDLENLILNMENNEVDSSVLEILKSNMEVERVKYAEICNSIEKEHIIENAKNPKQLIKEIKKFSKWYGGRFVVLESCVLNSKTF